MTDKQREAIDKLQAQQNQAAKPEERADFMRAIANVPREELETAPQPPPVKRGPKPKG
jgi:hypothetical protein